MTFKIFISSAIISAAIAALGTIIAAKIAQRSAKQTALEVTQREIAKLRETWKHEEETAFTQAFQEMVEAVSQYNLDSSVTKQEIARTKTIRVLVLTNGDLEKSISDLYDCLWYRPAKYVDVKLRAVIKCWQQNKLSSDEMNEEGC